MRFPALLLTSLLAAAPLSAQDLTLSQEIGARGITPVLTRLRALPAPTPEERFATAGLEFLSAVEGAYRWRIVNQVGAEWGMMFGMVADLSQTSAKPFPPAALAEQTEATLAAMTRVQAALPGLAEGPDFAVTLALSDLWFDLDGDGQRAPWEGAGELLNGVIFFRTPELDDDGNLLPMADLPVIRFDNADAAWLTAYSHLVAGGAELLLAFDPTPSLQKIWDARKVIDSHRLPDAPTFADLYGIDPYFEPIAAFLDLLRHQPDPARTQRAKAHWRETIRSNRQFWTLVGAETDDDNEWIPNDRQVSATGLEFPQGTGAAWLQVLDDAEALLEGRKSIPFWRAPVGLDLGAWFDAPGPLPLDGVLQGWAVTGYMTQAPPVTGESMDMFTRMFTSSSPFLAMVMIN
ncbi:hypothetical protein [Paenirhodobacter sp.]|uniref:hypothetical protein n=1 Tax=Paenirhodobacter sp. TaxID=1965326 RepID=UPI003B3E7994